MKLSPRSASRRKLVILCAIVFLLAFGVRLLTWHDTRFEVGKVQSSVAADYQRIADLFGQQGARGFFSSSSPLADLNNLGHPPGYSVLIALVRAFFGSSNAAVQFAQIVFDSFSAVLVLLIVAELFSLTPAVIAAAFAALSPQLAWNSVLLLPDSLAVFPILLAVFLLARSRKRPRLVTFLIIGVLIGALVGLSCWLRANAMLLTLFFAAAAVLLHGRKQWRFSLAVVAGTLLIILPLTIRNAIATGYFIPVSLGAGQTLLEGIADYDTDSRLGIPNTDMGIMKQEAEIYQRPDYYGTLFHPDGVARERMRMKRGVRVIASNPMWFTGVMIRRAASMTRLERARLISTTPAVTNPIETANLSPIVAPLTALQRCRADSPEARALFDVMNEWTLTVIGDTQKYGRQFSCGPFTVSANTDYLIELSGRIDQGRMRVSIEDANGHTYVSEILETFEVEPAGDATQVIQLPFVARARAIEIKMSSEASAAEPMGHIAPIKFYELGPARLLWTRYPRLLLHALQRVFVTAVFLPLALIGLGVTVFRKRTAALVILSVVPLYFFTVQSVFHTEYRYVLAVNYFLFAFAGIAVGVVISSLGHLVKNISALKGLGNK